MRKRRLKTLTDIRRFLADAMNRFESEEIDENRVKTIAYCCNVLSGIVKDSDLETRVNELERSMGAR